MRRPGRTRSTSRAAGWSALARLGCSSRVPHEAPRPVEEDPTLSTPSDPNAPQTRRERRLAERQQRRVREEQSSKRPGWQSPMVLITAAALIVGVVFIGAVVVMQNRPSGDGTLPLGLSAPTDPIPAGAVVDGQLIGDPNAPVTLEVYSDFQCPACRTFAEETEPLLRETYVVNGTLKIAYKDAAFQGQRGSNPDYDESVEAAAAARCAGAQGEFWTYHDWLFANWDGENQGAFRAERLQAIADAIGLDRASWDACVASGTEQAAVRTATNESVAAGIKLTPTLNVNGQVIEGAASYAQLSPIILEAAAAASPAVSGAPSASP